MANGNGTGKGGKNFNDRELAAKVRTLALEQTKQVLDGKLFKGDSAYHKAVLLKLAGTILPRLNYHGGENSENIKVEITGMKILTDGTGVQNKKS